MTGTIAATRHPARYFDGLSAESRPATAWADTNGVWIEREGEPARCWPFEEIVLMRGGRHEAVQLERRSTPVEVLVVDATGFLDELRASMPRGVKLSGGGPGLPGLQTLLMIAAVGALVLFSLYRFGIPMLAEVAADHVPPEWERQYGENVMRSLVPEAERVTAPEIVGPVRTAYRSLAKGAGLEDLPEHAIVWRQAMPNAFAAPGGSVVLTTGLLAILEDPDQMAAVIAHELGHVGHRHVIRSALRELSLGLLLGLVAGDQSVLSHGLRTAGELGGLSYSRDQEREADEVGLRLLEAHGVSGTALVGALERLKAASGSPGLPGFLSTHPAPEDRIRRIREHLAAPDERADAPWRDEAAWRALQQAVRAR